MKRNPHPMKRRYRVLLNLFSFALLLFALYLNFIKKESSEIFVLDTSQNSTLPIAGLLKIQGHQTENYIPSDGTLILK